MTAKSAEAKSTPHNKQDKKSLSDQFKLHLKPLPLGSTARGLRSLFAGSKPIHVEVGSGGAEAVVVFATAADEEAGRQCWDKCQAALGTSSYHSRRGEKRLRQQAKTNRHSEQQLQEGTRAQHESVDVPLGKKRKSEAAFSRRDKLRGDGQDGDVVEQNQRPQEGTRAQRESVDVPLGKKRKSGTTVSRRDKLRGDGQDGDVVEQNQRPQADAAARLRLQSLIYQISSLAARRQLGGAKAVFEQVIQEGLVPNVQTFAALINAHVNSGDVTGAIHTFNSMRESGLAPNVVVYTALLKGHCRIGDIRSAAALLDQMGQQQPPVLPDLRAVNTFLRGCSRVGDVTAAEDVYRAARTRWQLEPDDAARKFMVRLLSHALRLEDAAAIIQEQESVSKTGVQRSMKDNTRTSGMEPSAMGPGIAAPCIFWANGRCKKGVKCRFLHDTNIVQNNALRAEREARRLKMEHLGATAAMYVDFAHAAAVLSRWADCETNLGLAMDKLALMSQITVEDDTDAVHVAASKSLSSTVARIQNFARPRQALNLTQCFGRTFIFPAQSGACVKKSLLKALRSSFGLDVCIQLGLASFRDLNRRFRRCALKSGRLNWRHVFGKSRSALPVKLEIGAGSGEWALAQARSEHSCANWVALELMHDRVFEIFSRSALEAVPNLCVLGGDAAQILPRRIEQASVDHVFANFPEPPHVSGNEAAESSLHLWSETFFRAVHDILRPHGGITILTDNRKYCYALARTVAGLESQHGTFARLFRSKTVPCSASKGPKRKKNRTQSRVELVAEVAMREDIDGICVHHGTPGAESGHVIKLSSQFDSMWESSHRTERFFLCLEKI